MTTDLDLSQPRVTGGGQGWKGGRWGLLCEDDNDDKMTMSRGRCILIKVTHKQWTTNKR